MRKKFICMLEKKQYTEQELLDEIEQMDMETYLKEHSGVKYIDSKKLMEQAIAESQQLGSRERLLERIARMKSGKTYEEIVAEYGGRGVLHHLDKLGTKHLDECKIDEKGEGL